MPTVVDRCFLQPVQLKNRERWVDACFFCVGEKWMLGSTLRVQWHETRNPKPSREKERTCSNCSAHLIHRRSVCVAEEEEEKERWQTKMRRKRCPLTWRVLRRAGMEWRADLANVEPSRAHPWFLPSFFMSAFVRQTCLT